MLLKAKFLRFSTTLRTLFILPKHICTIVFKFTKQLLKSDLKQNLFSDVFRYKLRSNMMAPKNMFDKKNQI